MNVLDIGVILVLLMFFIVGIKQGIIRELLALVGTILIFYLSFALSGISGNILAICLPFIEFKGILEGISSVNILMYHIIAFMIIFCILLTFYELLIKFSKFLQKLVNMTIVLLIPSKILGGVVGAIKGYIILFLILLALAIPFGNTTAFGESYFAETILYNTPLLSNSVGSITKSTRETYQLIEKLSNNKTTSREANLDLLDILLRNNMTNKEVVEELVRKNKLTNVQGYEEVLSRY